MTFQERSQLPRTTQPIVPIVRATRSTSAQYELQLAVPRASHLEQQPEPVAARTVEEF
jgi:hypothetical protein